MGVNTSWTGVRGGFPRIDVELNSEARDVDNNLIYYPAKVIVAGMLTSADAGEKRHVHTEYVGPSQSAEYTPKEVYTYIGHASVPGILQNCVKTWYQTGIDVDISS